MRSRCFVVMLLLLLLALVCATSASATNWFVAPNGSDTTGNGSIGSPWASVAHALSNDAYA